MGLFAMAGLGGSMYLYGVHSGSPQARETGVLSTEAAVDALIFGEGAKNIFRRQRPFTGPGASEFFREPFGISSNASFPSGHATISWAIASVIAHEYPGWLTETGVYGLATGISLARVAGQKHFPSDVLIGGVSGYLIGRTVYNRHHDLDLPGADIGVFVKSEPEPGSSHASRYLAFDDPAYAAFERLAGMGYLATNISNARPWTRAECARLVIEAEEIDRARQSGDPTVSELLSSLREEFSRDIEIADGKADREAGVESLYTRAVVIAGDPLIDNYHFGRTIQNDFGRPIHQGFNDYTGASIFATHDAWTFSFRAEFQHSPDGHPYSLSTQQAIAKADETPLQGSPLAAGTDRIRILDAYLTRAFGNLQVSFGKQSLWWGPGIAGGMIASTNADPITMLRFSNNRPFQLPSIGRLLGGVSAQIFIGRLEGYHYLQTSSELFTPPIKRQPLIHGEKLEFKPTSNLEFGVSLTNVFAGSGVPLTLHEFLLAFSPGNTIPGQRGDPGDRRTGFDFKYRLPGLRNWLSLYSDSFAEDEINPIAYPRRSAFAPGIYLSHVPGLHRMDARVEGYYTDLPNLRDTGTYYYNHHYLSGYTNDGNLIGHPIGREGRGISAFSDYWLSGTNVIKATYRHIHVNPNFLEGGTIDDAGISTSLQFRKQWSLDAGVQYERWSFPVLAPQQRDNVTSSLTITYHPKFRLPL